MALPLLALASVVGAAAVHINNRQHYKKVELKRHYKAEAGEYRTIKEPSDYYDRSTLVKPKAGSVICCELYGVLDHTGIYIDDDTVVELSSSGLVRAISMERFLENRSGSHVFVACDQNQQPIIIDGTADRALSQVFTFREYDLIHQNCHRFVFNCCSAVDKEITRFSTLSNELATLARQNIYWDKAAI